MFIAVLLTVAKTWKQPECPLTDEWIKKTWCMQIIEYYSAKITSLTSGVGKIGQPLVKE